MVNVAAIPTSNEKLKGVLMQGSEFKMMNTAYKGMMGAYNSQARMLKWSTRDLWTAIDRRFSGVGMKERPTFEGKTLQKMGIASTPPPVFSESH